ncbi:hypothetical protein C8J57DRAFT_1522618 [Mycena rebaudengoi]|nr:hypothetical protein C8J57DRAFT_1522618 [Mycena rebaudengoi]
MVLCAGCQEEFSLSGYTHHLQTTPNSACEAIYLANQSRAPLLDSDDDENQPINFAGDYFGTYEEEDFNMDQDPQPVQKEGSDGADFDDLPDLADRSDSDSDSDEGEDVVDMATRWEPRMVDNEEFPGLGTQVPEEPPAQLGADGVPTREGRMRAEEEVHTEKSFIIEFTDGDAGAPICQGEGGYDRYQSELGDPANVWAPFTSKVDWELAQWAKLRGPGSTAFTELLKISRVAEKLGLSYKNSRELNGIIDKKLPGRPKFQRQEIIVGGEAYDVAPERHYADEDHTMRLYHDMHTGKWWWATQRELEKTRKGATIIPIIISSDKNPPYPLPQSHRIPGLSNHRQYP